MKPYIGLTLLAALAAFPAQALRVTNLDTVPHTVLYVAAGTEHRETVMPNATVNFFNLPNGRLSLLTSPHPREGGAVNADGMLSGYIGNGRDQGVPVDIMDDYVIWQGGQLQMQRRMKHYAHD